jgi:hypothetical protein
LRGGTYRINRTFELNERDSGETCAPVVYRSYPGESAVISGGRVLNVQWDDYNHNGRVIKVANVSDFLRENRINTFRVLFVNEKRATRARTPNEGDYYRLNPLSPPSNKGFNFSGNDLNSSWTNLNQVEIVSFLRDWFDQHNHIMSVDDASKIVLFNEDATYLYLARSFYFAENVFEGLDAEGEWYLNNNTKMLYYYPRSGEDITRSSVEIPVLESILTIRSSSVQMPSNLIVQNLGFSESASRFYSSPFSAYGSYAISFFCLNCTFRENSLFRLSNLAISARMSGGLIEKNNFFDLGFSGISLGYSEGIGSGWNNHVGYNVAETNFIIDNVIKDFGKLLMHSEGIKLSNHLNTIVAFNEVYNGPYLGIYSLSDVRGSAIAGNDIHDVMQKLADGAGIYIWNINDMVVRGNKVHDLSSTYPYPLAANVNGIYFDDGTIRSAAVNNIIYNISWAGLLVQCDITNNSFKNNLIVDSSYPLTYNFFNSSILGYGEGNKITRNVVFNAVLPTVLPIKYFSGSKMYLNRKTGTHEAITDFTRRLVNYSDNNLFYRPSGWNMVQVDEMRNLFGWDAQSLFSEDPLIANYKAGETVREGSPAISIGFEPFTIRTGPRSAS